MSTITVDGRATHDPEMKFLPSGQAVAEFTVAENHRKKSPSGEWVDDGASFYRVSVWGRRAENVAENIRKGTPVLVTGRLRVREYETREGGKGKSVDITADTVAVIPLANRSSSPAAQSAPSGGQPADPWAVGNDEPPF